MYLLWSFIAALTMSVTSYLRTLVSGTPFTSFFVLAFSYLLIASVALVAIKCVKKKDFRMAWY